MHTTTWSSRVALSFSALPSPSAPDSTSSLTLCCAMAAKMSSNSSIIDVALSSTARKNAREEATLAYVKYAWVAFSSWR